MNSYSLIENSVFFLVRLQNVYVLNNNSNMALQTYLNIFIGALFLFCFVFPSVLWSRLRKVWNKIGLRMGGDELTFPCCWALTLACLEIYKHTTVKKKKKKHALCVTFLICIKVNPTSFDFIGWLKLTDTAVINGCLWTMQRLTCWMAIIYKFFSGRQSNVWAVLAFKMWQVKVIVSSNIKIQSCFSMQRGMEHKLFIGQMRGFSTYL